MNTLTRVKAFQTSDDRVFTEEVAAIQHEFFLEVRGFFQRGTNVSHRNETYHVNDVARIITGKGDELKNMLVSYNKRMKKFNITLQPNSVRTGPLDLSNE
jgi:hypothetical protein